MQGLVGEYECKLDAKGRFLFPSSLRKQLNPASDERFMLNKGFEDCLTLYPMDEWDRVSKQLSKLNLFKPKNRMFYRLFHQGAKFTELDSTGRIHVPKAHMSRVGLEKNIMLNAYNDRIEIWDQDKYLAMMDDQMQNFADLADEVMGDLGNSDESDEQK